jgi:ferredoxin/flavodoxin
MKIGVYYFSGTGNSLYVAKGITAKTGGTLIPIVSIMGKDDIKIDSEVIGIVFPVYYGELPVVIKRFAQQLVDIGQKYIFAVCTFGGSAGYSLKLLKRIIQARGGTLSATYRVHMPQNSFPKPFENHTRLFSTWEKKQLGQIINNTYNRKKGEFFKHVFLAPIFLLADHTVNFMKPTYRKSFIKLSNASADLNTNDLIHLNDTSFSVTERCNRCGICVKVCPVNNIEIVDKKPVWQHRCENCLACYNWCPTRAIRGGIAAKGFYYHHPDIKAAEMMKQRSIQQG